MQSALRQLDLDYVITSISGGAGHDYEISVGSLLLVPWEIGLSRDKPRNSYSISIRVPIGRLIGLSRLEHTMICLRPTAHGSCATPRIEASGVHGTSQETWRI